MEKGLWPGSHDPQNYWALKAYTVKDTDLTFDVHVSRDTPDMIP